MPDVRTGTPQCGLDRVISPFAQARDRLDTITGVGQRAGRVHDRRDRGGHVDIPHCLAPGVVGGPLSRQQHHRRQTLLGKPAKGNRWLADVLTECAWAAARSRDSYLSAQFWRLARRIGKEGDHRRGALDSRDRLAPTCQPLRLRGPRGRPFRPTRHRPPASTCPRPAPSPRLPRRPRTRRCVTPGDSRFRSVCEHQLVAVGVAAPTARTPARRAPGRCRLGR
jgi:hypothetical protein